MPSVEPYQENMPGMQGLAIYGLEVERHNFSAEMSEHVFNLASYSSFALHKDYMCIPARCVGSSIVMADVDFLTQVRMMQFK